jgi:hypothetical protein
MVLGVLIWQALWSGQPDPVFDGIPLTEWMAGYVASPSASEAADQVLGKVGTNAIPTLLRMLQKRDSTFKCKAMELVQKQHFVKVHFIPAAQCNQGAYFAFLKLGARAEGAVPALMRIFEMNVSPFSQQCTANSLASLGPAANVAIPLLVTALTNSSPLVRQDIVNSLGRFDCQPDLVIPSLANALADPAVRVRGQACAVMMFKGSRAKSAVPALLKALNDPDSSVRGSAAAALRLIDPEAAAKAGIQ